jgi:branched-subunit amino acid ABC-type transport system permease component
LQTVIVFLVRLLLIAAGLVFAALLACLFVLLWAVWSVRALWARLTGRPVHPFVMRTGPRAAFEEMMRRAEAQREPSRTPRADAAGASGRARGDVTDVEPK